MNKSIPTIRPLINEDLPSLARLRSTSKDEVSFWENRIAQYLAGTHNPQKALPQRVIFVAEIDGALAGFIAGQLTTRYDCEGEVQWLNVAPGLRRKKIGSTLVQVLAKWFIEKHAYKVCVDPGNEAARLFYFANGATDLNAHWMYWKNIKQILVK